jgi:hypothetical protein
MGLEKVHNLKDIPSFIEWMYKNEEKWLPLHYKLIIVNNIITGYQLLNGTINFKRMKSKRQILLMWVFISRYRKMDLILLKKSFIQSLAKQRS